MCMLHEMEMMIDKYNLYDDDFFDYYYYYHLHYIYLLIFMFIFMNMSQMYDYCLCYFVYFISMDFSLFIYFCLLSLL